MENFWLVSIFILEQRHSTVSLFSVSGGRYWQSETAALLSEAERQCYSRIPPPVTAQRILALCLSAFLGQNDHSIEPQQQPHTDRPDSVQ